MVARDGSATVTASETVVWVESEVEGATGVTADPAQYTITGLTGADAENLYGLAENMDLTPAPRRSRTARCCRCRVSTAPGRSNPGELFFTGSSTGYGPAEEGRTPGFWRLGDNTFEPVGGLRDPDMMEISGSVWAGPVQDQRMLVVGGGGVGESPLSTTRTDVIDLTAAQPTYTPGPDLPEPTRCPNVVTLPTDEILIAGGSRDYRGKGQSHIFEASLYTPSSNTLRPAAESSVGRDYHSAGILLPNGQVIVMGGDALFSDPLNTRDADFEHRLEIYTPPYLFHGPRPEITGAPATVALGATMTVSTPGAARIDRARLIRPSAATHVTDLEQRSVALDVERRPDGTLGLAVPAEPTITPPGFYMLFLVDDQGTPSTASWVRVT